VKLSETIMEINDLRVLLDLSPRRSRSDTKGVTVGWAQDRAPERVTHHPTKHQPLALIRLPRRNSSLQNSEFTIQSFPFALLQNVKEQAPKRRTLHYHASVGTQVNMFNLAFAGSPSPSENFANSPTTSYALVDETTWSKT
jgi:hypothetical protein